MKLKFTLSAKIMKWLLSLIFTYSFLAYGQNEKKYIRDGNTKYKDGKFAESEVSYRKAISKSTVPTDAGFNLGDALYKQNKFEEAGKEFLDNSQVTTENRKKSNSFYNLGNSMLNNKKIQESIEAYKNSLKLNPDNVEAKYNLAYAQDLLRTQQNQKDQNKENDKDKKKENQNKDQKQNQDKNQNNNNQNQKQDQQKQQQQNQKSISKEDAQRLLDAIANDEKNVQEKVKLAKATQAKVRTLKNW
jgi:Ca-activated chloride channel family protein